MVKSEKLKPKTGKPKTGLKSSSTSDKKESFELIIPDKNLLELKQEPADSEDEFNAITLSNTIKCENVDTELCAAGQFETVYITPPRIIIQESDEILKLKTEPTTTTTELTSNNETQLSSFCRLCAKQCERMINILGQNEVSRNITRKINYCLPVKYRRGDNLPKQVCQACSENLDWCYRFNKSVTDAAKKLRVYCRRSLGSVKTNRKYSQNSFIDNNQSSKELNSLNNAAENSENSKKISEQIQTIDDDQRTPENYTIEPNSNIYSKELLNPDKTQGFENKFNETDGKRKSPIDEEEEEEEENAGIHPSTYDYSCNICNEVFKSEIECKKHRLEHEKMKRIIRITKDGKKNCIIKSENNFSAQLKQRFKKLYRKGEEEQFRIQEEPDPDGWKNDLAVECTLCKRRFHSDAIEMHEKICIEQRFKKKAFFSCDYCGKEFERKIHVAAHIRMHTGERPFRCKFCSQRFKSKKGLNYHLKIHNGGKLFECPICRIGFTKISSLRGHGRIHSRKRMCECPLCNEIFATKTERNNHMDVHNGEKFYQCDLCENYFKTKCNLSKHLKTQHEQFRDERKIISNSTFSN